jgi:hypothetical protein
VVTHYDIKIVEGFFGKHTVKIRNGIFASPVQNIRRHIGRQTGGITCTQKKLSVASEDEDIGCSHFGNTAYIFFKLGSVFRNQILKSPIFRNGGKGFYVRGNAVGGTLHKRIAGLHRVVGKYGGQDNAKQNKAYENYCRNRRQISGKDAFKHALALPYVFCLLLYHNNPKNANNKLVNYL